MNGRHLDMEADSGASQSITSCDTFKCLWQGRPPKLERCDLSLSVWAEDKMQLDGKLPVNVQFKGREARLGLYVVIRRGASLLGQDRYPALNIKISGVHVVSSETPATRPWETIHIDFTGLIDGVLYLVVVDAYSDRKSVV